MSKMPMDKKARSKMEKTMHEFKEGNLKSGSKKGPAVKSRKQAIAIGLNQARKVEGKGTARRSQIRRTRSS